MSSEWDIIAFYSFSNKCMAGCAFLVRSTCTQERESVKGRGCYERTQSQLLVSCVKSGRACASGYVSNGVMERVKNNDEGSADVMMRVWNWWTTLVLSLNAFFMSTQLPLHSHSSNQWSSLLSMQQLDLLFYAHTALHSTQQAVNDVSDFRLTLFV